ncbi:male sterility protein [Thozetella sp. PMI_491]|nr:male sterility protein [Thozetella sp. PMI_491]
MGSTSVDAIPEVEVKELDPYVFPPPDADAHLLKLWNMNGHLYSTRYTNPDITSLSALIRHNAKTQPNSLAYLYPTGQSGKEFQRVSFLELDELVTKAAALYARMFATEIANANQETTQPTIAMIGVGITFDYFITLLALLRLHVRVLLLSNKNALVAHQHLLGSCNAVGCIVDATNTDAIGTEQGFLQAPIGLATIEELQKGDAGNDQTDGSKLGFKTDDEWNLPSVIIHSCGTTGMPKPIIHTNRSICLIARHYRLYRDFYIENFQLCAPLFHVGGFSVAIGGLAVGLATTFPPPNWPPATSAILVGWETVSAMGHPVDCAQIAPALVEEMFLYIESTTNDFTPLSKLMALQSGGAPFAPALHKKLVALKVNMKTICGQTEIAGPTRTLPHGRENPHMARLRNLYAGTGWVVMEDLGAGDGSAECVVYKGYPLAAELWDAPDAPNPYRTNDVFREDPLGSGFWVLLGRKDDVIVHSNGEKTMAGGVATLLGDSGAVVARAAVFGTNRLCTAAILEVRWEAIGDADEKTVEDMVWEAVQACNQQIPKHSRIDRSLILILGRGEALPVTPKRTVRRKAAWELYGGRVDVLFDKFLQGSPDEISTCTEDLAGLSDADYIKACVSSVCDLPSGADVSDMSLYEAGLDSQRAVRLRSLLSKRFGPFPLMFIFENPTFEKLVPYLESLKSKDTVAAGSREQEKMAWIRDTVGRYCHEIDSWKIAKEASPQSQANGHQEGHVIFLTGANGALGNSLLDVLVKDSSVSRIYCAIRGADPGAKLEKSLESRGYGASIGQSRKLSVVPYDMKDSKLGLDDEAYLRLLGEVTTVVHNAWRLDFNQPVDMFEPDCLRGTMNLLSFCLSGRKKTFAFTSSISTVMGPALAGQKILEIPASDDPRSASGTGYAQSKYVVERITKHYASALQMPVRLLRVGQLCGHSVLGTWNETEMWPIMMATGLDYLQAMPLFSRTVNWLPVDACAGAIAQILTNGSGELYTVDNLAHPTPVAWSAFLDSLTEASGKTFARIPMSEWVASLENLADTEGVPGVKLLGYFQEMAAAPDREQSEVVTRSAAGLEPLDATAVRKWLEGWHTSGFVKI